MELPPWSVLLQESNAALSDQDTETPEYLILRLDVCMDLSFSHCIFNPVLGGSLIPATYRGTTKPCSVTFPPSS